MHIARYNKNKHMNNCSYVIEKNDGNGNNPQKGMSYEEIIQD